MDRDPITGSAPQGEASTCSNNIKQLGIAVLNYESGKDRGITISVAHIEYDTNNADCLFEDSPRLGGLVKNITSVLAISRAQLGSETLELVHESIERIYEFYPDFPSVSTVLPGETGDQEPLPRDRVLFGLNHFNNAVIYDQVPDILT